MCRSYIFSYGILSFQFYYFVRCFEIFSLSGISKFFYQQEVEWVVRKMHQSIVPWWFHNSAISLAPHEHCDNKTGMSPWTKTIHVINFEFLQEPSSTTQLTRTSVNEINGNQKRPGLANTPVTKVDFVPVFWCCHGWWKCDGREHHSLRNLKQIFSSSCLTSRCRKLFLLCLSVNSCTQLPIFVFFPKACKRLEIHWRVVVDNAFGH